ncbi:right-handed parallel beta-helix repeat-containing protein [Marininema halotolerans]|uniref:Parallel beta-helix repeat (Two copies) n=1 Tax=Marininema halotolerans TaxID=1155944 RepID=A0A1I6UK49_9BACL|nr:right-handed parallel beta-helix repeat-containing protein [Marininema halotolerans]SFT01835.1 parallel beta-helix repeat (two copies) [Marininema halotolerans]
MTQFNVKTFGAKGNGTADDAPAIQKALTAAREAGGGTVFVPGGIYNVGNLLKIYDHTTLELDKNALIRRQSDASVMIINGTNGQGGYLGSQDIEIIGGTWDANMKLNTISCTVIAIGHATNVRVRDTKVLNVYNWHGVELNGVNRGEVSRCLFSGFTLTRKWSEAIQLDIMISTDAFPWFGPYDNTYCRNILIEGCAFTSDWYRGIGSHSKAEDVYHAHVRIINNHFEYLAGSAIEAYRYRHVSIQGNTFSKVETGIHLRDSAYFSIGGNSIRYPEKDGILLTGSFGNSIVGNVVRGAGGAGIYVDANSERNNLLGNAFTDCANGGIVDRGSKTTRSGNRNR